VGDSGKRELGHCDLLRTVADSSLAVYYRS
jgi:hypothetical protein